MTDPHARSRKLPAAKPLRPIGEMSSLAHNAQLTQLALDAPWAGQHPSAPSASPRTGRPSTAEAVPPMPGTTW